LKKVKFLYWNTENKKNVELLLADLLAATDFNVIILAEAKKPLSAKFKKQYNLIEEKLFSSEKERLKVRVYHNNSSDITISHLNNVPGEEVTEVKVQDTIDGILIHRRITKIARVVNLELRIDTNSYLLSCMHFPSKKNQDDVSQLHTAFNYKRYILERAEKFNHNTIIVGDFNMNPFDHGMVEPHGFFALNNSGFVAGKRTVQHSVEVMFYNPCWWLLGDYHPKKGSRKMSGTHYFSGSPSKKLYWHLFDQVIVSKSMVERFNHDDLEILEIDDLIKEVVSSVSRKNAKFPDHLPITFSLNL
jgi:exonuclease III